MDKLEKMELGYGNEKPKNPRVVIADNYNKVIEKLNEVIDAVEDLIPVGSAGLSAYEIAVENGFAGTEQQWLDSLVGEDGAAGTGTPGASAYEVAVANGYSGTELQWLASLAGDVVAEEMLASLTGNRFYVPETFVWTASLATYVDTVMVITYAHAVGAGNITLPAGCTLQFEGGSIATTGNIVGSNSRIINESSLPCFSIDVNFTGTWSSTTCNYQWFGAKTVPTITSYINECSAAINKAHNSPFKVEPIPGFYYITDTLIYNQPKSIYFGRSPMELQGGNPLVGKIRPDHVRFITDADIDIWDIRCDNVHLYGGTIDVIGAGTYTKDAIKYLMEQCVIITGTIWETNVIGSKTGNKVLGASGKAFHVDMTGNVSLRYIENINVSFRSDCMPYGVYIDDDSTGNADTYFGSNNIHAITWGSKQGFVVKGGKFHNYYSGYTQTIPFLANEEQDLYQAEFTGGNVIDIFNWDLHSRDDLEDGAYWPSRGTLLKGNNNTLIGKSLVNNYIAYENPLHSSVPVVNVTHKSGMEVLAQKTNKSNFISELNNILIGWHKKGAVTVKAHSGATINFDDTTPTIGSEAETANIAISNAHSLFLLSGFSTYYTFGAGADLDKDFVEIGLTGRDISGVNAYVALSATARGIKRVQVIGFKSSGNPDIYNSAVSATDTATEKVFKFPLISGTYTSMAIRLIGCRQTGDIVSINDIAVESLNVVGGHNFVPATSAPRASHEGWLNQTGTNNGVVTSFINSFVNSAGTVITPTLTRQGKGQYRFNINDALPVNKTMPKTKYIVYTDLGRIETTLSTTSYYTINTYDTLGVLSDDILVDHPMFVSIYW